MEKVIKVTGDTLFLPICTGKTEKKLEIYLEGTKAPEKLFEFIIPVGDTADGAYPYDYMARFPVEKFTDKTLTLVGDIPQAFWKEVFTASFHPKKTCDRPAFHFTADYGWINDPNGLVYQDGSYHLYFQYNPFDTKWNNMSWGHAVSQDLLHWKQEKSVLFPDEDGMIFSGSAITNDRELLGFSKDTLLFFYSAAGSSNEWSQGKEFVQKLAYSTDGGQTLEKQAAPCLPTIAKENRDPKVFYHKKSGGYIMCLWLEENEFALFRSEDLAVWTQTDRFTLKDAWECPDLVELMDEKGKSHWMFWSADGFYYWGEFDGYRFTTDKKKHEAYFNKVPYAAQTYSGVLERTISVPWLRFNNHGENHTGAMGIPVELSARQVGDDICLVQKPVRELEECLKEVSLEELKHDTAALYLVRAAGEKEGERDATFKLELNHTAVSYESATGKLTVDEAVFLVGAGKSQFSILVDQNICEIFVENGSKMGAFELKESAISCKIEGEELGRWKIYEAEHNR